MLYIIRRSEFNVIDVCATKLDDNIDNIDKELLLNKIFFVIIIANLCNGKFYHRPIIFKTPKPGLLISTSLVFSTDDDYCDFQEELRYYFNF